MATHTLGSFDCDVNNGDRVAGTKVTFAGSGTAVGYDNTTYIYSGVSVALYMSSVKYYSKYGYFDVYNQNGTLIGRTKTWSSAENKGDVKASNASSVSCTFTLINVDTAAALQASDFYLYIRRTSSSGNVCNIRNACTGKLTITYTRTVRNTAPGTPTIVYPASASKTTYNTKPWFRFKTGTDAESSSITTYWRVDSGTWQTYSSATGSNNDKQWTTALSAGAHTVYAYSSDGTATSSEVSRAFTVGTPAAAITKNSTIDDSQISTMKTQINNQRAYYGLGNGSYSTITAGTTKCDDAHLDEMETALEATPHCPTIASVDANATIVIAHMNAFRTALLSC